MTFIAPKPDKTRAFWDPDTNSEFARADHIHDIDATYSGLFIMKDGKKIYVSELLDRLEKVEEALADFLLLGPSNESDKR